MSNCRDAAEIRTEHVRQSVLHTGDLSVAGFIGIQAQLRSGYLATDLLQRSFGASSDFTKHYRYEKSRAEASVGTSEVPVDAVSPNAVRYPRSLLSINVLP